MSFIFIRIFILFLLYVQSKGLPNSTLTTENPAFVNESTTLNVETTTAPPDDGIPKLPFSGFYIFLAIALILGVAAVISLILGVRKEIEIQKKEEEQEEKLKNTKCFYSKFGADQSGHTLIMVSPDEKKTIIYLPGVFDLPKNVVTDIIAAVIKSQEVIPETDKENNSNPVISEERHDEITEPPVIEPTQELKEVVVDTKEEKKKKWRLFPFSKGKGKKSVDIESQNTNEPQIKEPTQELQKDARVDTKEKKKRRFLPFLKGKGKKAVDIEEAQEKINDQKEELQNNAEIDLEKGREEVAVETKEEKKKKWRFWYKKKKKEMNVTDLP